MSEERGRVVKRNRRIGRMLRSPVVDEKKAGNRVEKQSTKKERGGGGKGGGGGCRESRVRTLLTSGNVTRCSEQV